MRDGDLLHRWNVGGIRDLRYNGEVMGLAAKQLDALNKGCTEASVQDQRGRRG